MKEKSLANWWRFEAKYYCKDILHGVRNLIKWFPVIWKDRDWDSYFIYEIMAAKLANQAKYIGDKDRHTMAKRDSERMWLVTRLIRLQQDDFYETEYMDYCESAHYWSDQKYATQMESPVSQSEDKLEEYFKKYPLQYKKAISGEINRYDRPVHEKDKRLIAMEIAHENQNRCHQLIFKIMKNHIEGWWD